MLYNVFVYGSLRDADTLYRLLRRNPPTRPARVNDYRKFVDDASGYPMAIHEKGSFVDGTLLTGIGNRDLSALDNYEGTHKGLYKRITVQVLPAGSKTPVEAQMYVKGAGEL
ncbi:MAG TPA: gamma-glutamylcyclotransferase family protein [Methanocella sp.]|nr:gamma-glutamylcyclotransferase family protein [Methanocella sp.]